ncbi:alpha/beta hydrolase [Paroceanicella profunda]|uniref:Alpha/beta hydrolase n=1 Tax=Paroceanicella profunda TaxID=2579971 RepID=A0A5B8FI83_9RHOB|nr:alpha/beta fold hydrolase [Paroceanicella profunda]QDL93461.1 alpha/beta hydrolase [Paroceanicella profunda]
MRDYTIPDIHVREHEIAVPLDWSKPEGETITLFARECVDPARRHEELPLLAYLQGGPGGKAPRPEGGGPAWLGRALQSRRVVLIDQRGTGRSSPLEGRDMDRFADGRAAADHLALFRADSIVRDCEALRKGVYGGRRWETLGQSYGGFLTLTYLSTAPEGLAACYVTGGLSGLEATAEDVYRHTYPRVAARQAGFLARYPGDAARLDAIADMLEAEDQRLPDGDRLTVRRFQTLGMELGRQPGFEALHWLLDEAQGPHGLTPVFLAEVMQRTSYHANPLYAVLQECIYAQNGAVTGWAAERVRAELPAFAPGARPLMLTGEMMYPWMFEEIASLRPFRAAAEALHARPFEAPLYDPARLAANEVPVAAAVYFSDMYVDTRLSLDTAARVGNLRPWVTSAHEHDGLRRNPDVLSRLMDMVHRNAD